MQCPSVGAKLEFILDNLATAPLGVTEDESFRISTAGAQEKTAFCVGTVDGVGPAAQLRRRTSSGLRLESSPNGVDLTSSVENESAKRLEIRTSLINGSLRFRKLVDKPHDGLNEVKIV
jgi:hypothetical protein